MAAQPSPAAPIPMKEPRTFPTTGFATVPPQKKLDEENWPFYKPESFYPVNIGDVLNSRYQVLYKIGYGTVSTVWICRDLMQDKYVCMKSLVWDFKCVDRELEAYRRLDEVKTSPLGGHILVRKLLDRFQLLGDGHTFHFLIHEPLGITLEDVLRFLGGKFPFFGIQAQCAYFIYAVEFLHHANVIHADINASNIMYSLANLSMFSKLEEDEIRGPSSRKTIGDRIIFDTRSIYGSLDEILGPESRPVLCDMGEARLGDKLLEEYAQTPTYRAPEIFFGLPWGKPVDIWNLGCMMWHCATGKYLFPRNAPEEEGDQDEADRTQIGTMVALLGPPPKRLLDKALEAGRADHLLNEDGSLKYKAPPETLESRLASYFKEDANTPTEEQAKWFLSLIRRLLTWDDEERPTAKELTTDQWITNLKGRLF